MKKEKALKEDILFLVFDIHRDTRDQLKNKGYITLIL